MTTAPHAVLPGATLVGSGRHCGWQSSPACRPHRCGSPSPRRPVQGCPVPRCSVLAYTAACPRRRHAIRLLAVSRRVHGAPCSVVRHHSGRCYLSSSAAWHHVARCCAHSHDIVLLRIIRSASCFSTPHDHPDTPWRIIQTHPGDPPFSPQVVRVARNCSLLCSAIPSWRALRHPRLRRCVGDPPQSPPSVATDGLEISR